MTRLVISSLGFGCNDVDESSACLPSPTWAIRAPKILLRTRSVNNHETRADVSMKKADIRRGI